MKLTDRQVKNLKPKEDRYEVWEGNGFGLRVFPTEKKSWVMMYRFNQRLRRLTLGTYPKMTVAQVHAAFGRALTDLEQGIDPAEVEVAARLDARHAPTFDALAHSYVEKWAKPNKRSWREDQRIMDKDILPNWGRMKAKDIRRKDVVALLDAIVERGAPIAANRTLEVIRKMYNFGIERDLVYTNPCVMVRAPAAETRRARVLTPDEIGVFWNKLQHARMTRPIQLALQLQLTTAQRRGEIIATEWSEFDMASRWWTIPTEKSKNKMEHRVPLSHLAMDLLSEARCLSGDSFYLFPNTTGSDHIADRSVSRAVANNRDFFGLGHFTPHDLRRTAASHITSMGTPRLVVSKILNHVESGVTAVYDRHSYDEEKRAALEAWASRLVEIIGPAAMDASKPLPGED